MDLKLLEQICSHFLGVKESNGAEAPDGISDLFKAIRLDSGITALELMVRAMEGVTKGTISTGQAFIAGMVCAIGSGSPTFKDSFQKYFETVKRAQGENVVDFKMASVGRH